MRNEILLLIIIISIVCLSACVGKIPVSTTISNTGGNGTTNNYYYSNVTATIGVNSTFTGLPGSLANVTNIGNLTAARLDFTIPRGNTGATGPQGPHGQNYECSIWKAQEPELTWLGHDPDSGSVRVDFIQYEECHNIFLSFNIIVSAMPTSTTGLIISPDPKASDDPKSSFKYRFSCLETYMRGGIKNYADPFGYISFDDRITFSKFVSQYDNNMDWELDCTGFYKEV